MGFHILTLGPADAVQYYAACDTCNYLSAPFDREYLASRAGDRHTWERHSECVVLRSA